MIDLKKKRKSKSDPHQMLRTALNFTEDDLEANRSTGKLTPRQWRQLSGGRNYWISSLPRIAMVIGVFSIVYLWDLMPSRTPVNPSVIAVFALITIIIFMLNAHMNGLVLAQESVNVVDGKVSLDVGQSQKAIPYMLSVANQQFEVKKAVFLAFRNGDPYKIYYIKKPRIIVSAEWLYQQERHDD